jgi:succinate-semialdehyde dehydrogenase/glutarate-semialdehyde dehydrogenase
MSDWNRARHLTHELRRYVAAHAGGDRPVLAPWTGEQLGAVPECSPAETQAAVERARHAQPAWAALPFRRRAQIILRFHDLLLQRQNAVLGLMQWETGKARRHALEEVLDTAIVARYYAVHGEKMLRSRKRAGALPLLTTTWEHRHPRGVVGVISPWNYPLSLAATDAIPALLAGNAVVLKPDVQTPFTALWAARLLHEAGVPPDVFQIVTGDGPAVGGALIDAVDYVTFTGSTATGRVVARHAAERLIDCSLELGGKNAMLVLDDADLDAAVGGALRGCFASAGQLCISIERIYVAAPLYERFAQQFATRTQALRLGAGLNYGIEMGSLAGARQLATVQRHVDDAVAKGAHVLAGGRQRPDLGPFFYEPTVLENVNESMLLFAEETFGPVVALYRVESVEEAICAANASRYGLNASVYTRDHARGRAVAQRLHAGTVNINEAYAAAWGSVDAPMGGFKESGIGRRHGREGMLRFTEPQTVAVQRVTPIAPPRMLPMAWFARLLTGWLKLLRHLARLR